MPSSRASERTRERNETPPFASPPFPAIVPLASPLTSLATPRGALRARTDDEAAAYAAEAAEAAEKAGGAAPAGGAAATMSRTQRMLGGRPKFLGGTGSRPVTAPA